MADETIINVDEIRDQYLVKSKELFELRKSLIEAVTEMTKKQGEFAVSVAELTTKIDTLQQASTKIYEELHDMEMTSAGIAVNKPPVKE